MKITSIKASSFIGASDVDVKLSRPVALFCGKNHSGKSSLSEAVRMALTGEPSRVSLKKNYKQLVSEGAEVGYAVVDHDGVQSAITLPNGAHEHTGSRRPSELLPFVLDAQRFAQLDANERCAYIDCGNTCVAHVFAETASDRDRNAALIAAAPKMLGLLQQLLFDASGKEWRDSEESDHEWDARTDEAKREAKALVTLLMGQV